MTSDLKDVDPTRRSSIVDDLQCWMGCIQLDHAYDGKLQPSQTVSSSFDHSYDCQLQQRHRDHPYDSTVDGRSCFAFVDCRRSAEASSDISAAESSHRDSSGIHSGSVHASAPGGNFLSKRTLRNRSLPFEHQDHAYDSSSHESVLQFDHSYDSGQFRNDHVAGPDWWDHAYVDSNDLDTAAAYSSSIRCSGRMAEFVESALG